MLMDVTPDGEYSPDETYYLLSDVLPEDKELREGLQEKRLVKNTGYIFVDDII